MESARHVATVAGPGGATLVVVGAGNIGSYLLPHLGRMDGVSCVIIVDRDTYTERNVRSQSISLADLGRPKAGVMARRLRAANPALRVVAIHDTLENIPPGLLQGHVWLTCLDSRVARQVANERVYRLGVPLWIDAGVQPSGRLARVSVYAPARDAPCMECLWNEDDYRDIAQSYACDGTPAQPAATNGISSLGALAASLQALECQAALSGEQPVARVARELVINAATYQSFRTELRRNPECRFDHLVWHPEPIAGSRRTLADIADAARGPGRRPSLQVDGHVFVRAVTCPACQRRVELALVTVGVSTASLSCHGCGARVPTRWDAVSDTLALYDLPDGLRRQSLRSLGLRHGDLVTVRAGDQDRHFVVRLTRSASAPRRVPHA